MRNCLIVLNPRNMEVCLESISKLKIDKLYMRAFDERSISCPMNDFIRMTAYDNYLLLADDVIVTNEALSLVNSLLETCEAATGYCLASMQDDFVNVTRGPLRASQPRFAAIEDYDFYYKREVELFTNPVFVTWLGGWCLTGFSRHVWLRNPFSVTPIGCQSDYATCRNYGGTLLCHRDAYVQHLKEETHKSNYTNFLVGKVKPEMIYETYGNYPNLEKREIDPPSIRLL